MMSTTGSNCDLLSEIDLKKQGSKSKWEVGNFGHFISLNYKSVIKKLIIKNI